MKTAIDDAEMKNCGWVHTTLLQKQATRRIWLVGFSLSVPDLIQLPHLQIRKKEAEKIGNSPESLDG